MYLKLCYRYKDLHLKEDVIEKDIEDYLAAEQIDVDVETAHREICQEDIVENSRKFLEELRENIEGDIGNALKRNDIRRGYKDIPLATPAPFGRN